MWIQYGSNSIGGYSAWVVAAAANNGDAVQDDEQPLLSEFSERYLKLRNNSGQPLKVSLQWLARRSNADNWLPSTKTASAVTLAPGQAINVNDPTHKPFVVQGKKVRVWATATKGRANTWQRWKSTDLALSFKAPWRSPAAHADMDAQQFLARLCALVPPPGFHMTRYYGVFASHHRLREHVIPRPAAPPPPPQLALDFALPDDPAPRPLLRHRHHPLPKMRRPHACPRGRLRCRRHRPHPPRRPRPTSTSSSWTGQVLLFA